MLKLQLHVVTKLVSTSLVDQIDIEAQSDILYHLLSIAMSSVGCMLWSSKTAVTCIRVSVTKWLMFTKY